MTDEEIRALAEKTRKEKFCPQYRECLYKHRDDIYDCSCRCPVSYADEFGIQCGDTIYEQGFLDGFKAGYKIGFDEGHDEGFTEARLGEDW